MYAEADVRMGGRRGSARCGQ